MATKQITTWAEFKTALTETITENTTYEIMNDIDISDEVLTNSINIVSNRLLKTINGNDHKINGLTHYSNFGVFDRAQSQVKIVFNNLHFSNFMIQSGYLFNFSEQPSSKDYYTTFNNCYFSGLVNRLFSTGNYGADTYVNFKRCSFNVQANMLLFSSRGCKFDNCYIIINPMEGTTSCVLWYRRDGYYPAMNNCYVTGALYISYNTTDCIVGDSFWNNNNCYHNVFNVEIHITNYSASTTYYWTWGTPPDDRAELYNSKKIFDNAGNNITMGKLDNFYGLTDSQLKSKTAINQNAPHFPLWG